MAPQRRAQRRRPESNRWEVPLVNLRLQGGPFCGHRITPPLQAVPRVVYVVGRFLNGVATGGSEWFPYPVDGCELYRHDDLRDGWHVFVWTDVMLDINLDLAELERAAA